MIHLALRKGLLKEAVTRKNMKTMILLRTKGVLELILGNLSYWVCSH